MAGRINWNELKTEFILSEYSSLREFAESKGLSYNGNFMNKTKGWDKEKVAKELQKSCKVVDKTIEKASEIESDINVQHLKVWSKILKKVDKIAEKDKITIINRSGEIEYIDINPKMLSDLSTAMEKIQKGQRLAKGLDKPESDSQDGNISKLIEAINKSDGDNK